MSGETYWIIFKNTQHTRNSIVLRRVHSRPQKNQNDLVNPPLSSQI